MRKYFVIAWLILFFCLPGYSQVWKRNRIEIYLGIPITHYFGDIGGSSDPNSMLGLKDISFRAMRPGISGGLGYRFSERFYAQGNLTLGLFGNTDKGSRNEARNYAFSTLGTEVAAVAQFYIIPESDQNYFYSIMQVRGGLRKINKPFSLYLFAGGGGYFFRVKPLNDLVDSDRFDDSKHSAIVVPFGLGFKYQILSRMLVGAELGGRYVLSDYIDGFSPEPSKYNDFYYVLNFKIYYRLPSNKILRKPQWTF
jgi:hypothetical protein